MRIFSARIVTAILVVASMSSLALTSADLGNTFDSIVSAFDRTHSSVGNATINELPNGSLLIAPKPDNVSGVSVPFSEVHQGRESTLNIIFEPVELAVGDQFISEVVNSAG
ncbi:MAG: hypothetical protein HKN13_01060, partial [Rhodothermales bacterium]|nr:hypothetical protein [Rhodothermales bacterium]